MTPSQAENATHDGQWARSGAESGHEAARLGGIQIGTSAVETRPALKLVADHIASGASPRSGTKSCVSTLVGTSWLSPAGQTGEPECWLRLT